MKSKANASEVNSAYGPKAVSVGLVLAASILFGFGAFLYWLMSTQLGFPEFQAVLPMFVICPVSVLLVAFAFSVVQGPRTFLRVHTGVKSKGKTAVAYPPKDSSRIHPEDLLDEKMEGPQTLRPGSVSAKTFVNTLFAAALWNGIGGYIFYRWARNEIDFGVDGVVTLFVPLALVGLGLVAMTVYTLRAALNPKVELSLSSGVARRGHPVKLEWRLLGNSLEAKALRIRIEGEEKVELANAEGPNVIHKASIGSIAVVDVVKPQEIPNGKASFTIPTDAMHSFEWEHLSVKWWIVIDVETPRRPNISERCELRVRP